MAFLCGSPKKRHIGRKKFGVIDKKPLCLCPLLQRTCLGKIAKTFILDEIKIWAYQNVLSTYRQCLCNLNQLSSAKKLFLKWLFLAKLSNNLIFLMQSFFHLKHVADSSGISIVDNRAQNWVLKFDLEQVLCQTNFLFNT